MLTVITGIAIDDNFSQKFLQQFALQVISLYCVYEILKNHIYL